ncbi:MAG TPA: DUF2917 domain-containing protein [Rhodocyclaceae bacterium]
MATITQETRVELSAREALTLGSLPGGLLTCASGEVWITVDGEGRDVVLGPASSHRIESDAPVVVSAFADSVLSIRRAVSPHPSIL